MKLRQSRFMPELPDIEVYREALAARLAGRRIERVKLLSPFVLRTVQPSLQSVEGREVRSLRRIGKRIAIEVDGGLFVVIHLMVAGRLRWLEGAGRPPARISLATFGFEHGTLVLTEAGTKRRASIHLVEGEPALAGLDPGGMEVADADLQAFAARLVDGNHSVKRALTDPRLFSGIGNAYSDEILHRARLSPFKPTRSLDEGELARLFHAARSTLAEWTGRLRAQAAGAFPEKVTAFRPEMAVHARYGLPCPDCGAPVQRIVYADNETNYCAHCQTGGRILADRALSRLLHDSWPCNLDELG